ncbi:MAG: hypothetical protein ACFE0J_08600 [Elainellaceae cyanobacterium]
MQGLLHPIQPIALGTLPCVPMGEPVARGISPCMHANEPIALGTPPCAPTRICGGAGHFGSPLQEKPLRVYTLNPSPKTGEGLQ